jgi:Protein of unknown function (DUF3047)
MVLVIGFFAAAPAPVDRNGDTLIVGAFSTASPGHLPDGWAPMTFKKIPRHTDYTVVPGTDGNVVRARSRASASGLIRRLSIAPGDYPIITWRWKIGGILKKGDVHKKSGDDYPARIYITFKYEPQNASWFQRAKFAAAKFIYGEYPPGSAINYIWASHAAQGTVVPNPYTDRVVMIAVESGAAKVDRWVSETRNLEADYRKAFGHAPPPITGVAIMTDTDNTGEAVDAWYGDIVFKRAGK